MFLYLALPQRDFIEMTEIKHSIDWFQYSVKWPDAIWQWPLERSEAYPIVKTAVPFIDASGWKPEGDDEHRILPMAGYPSTYDLLYASAHVDPNRPEQKIGVRMTGSNIGAYRSLGGTEGRLLAFYDKVGGKASRIDLAFDLFGYKVDLMRVYKDWKDGKVKSTCRTVQPFTKATRDNAGKVTEATTLYFGSRTSELMVRMYDKGAEQNVDLDWLRVELEIKGDKAPVVATDCGRLGVAAVGKALLRAFITKAPYKFWRELIEGESVELTPVERKMTAHDAWLLNVILPMIQQDIRQEWEGDHDRGITRNVEALIRENWTRRMMCLRDQYEYYERSTAVLDN